MKEKVGGLKRDLNTKVKLDIYKRFGKSVEFKKYLHGVCDAESRYLIRSGTHGLSLMTLTNSGFVGQEHF